MFRHLHSFVVIHIIYNFAAYNIYIDDSLSVFSLHDIVKDNPSCMLRSHLPQAESHLLPPILDQLFLIKEFKNTACTTIGHFSPFSLFLRSWTLYLNRDKMR